MIDQLCTVLMAAGLVLGPFAHEYEWAYVAMLAVVLLLLEQDHRSRRRPFSDGT